MSENKEIWFLADVIERAETGGDRNNPNRRCLTWINTLLIQASSIADAYDKAMSVAKNRYPDKYTAAAGNPVEWVLLGLASLRPIEEELKDGSEISSMDLGRISVKKSTSLIRSKEDFITDETLIRRVQTELDYS